MYNLSGQRTFVPARRRPPHPLGDAARYFPYSATTPQSQQHESGLQLRIKLSTPHPNIPFKSGELVEGAVIISRPGGPPSSDPIPIHSLVLRAYFESRTLFWHFGLLEPKTDGEKLKSKLALKAAQTHGLSVAHEVHRGLVPRETIEFSWEQGRAMSIYLDEIGSADRTPELALPFAFPLPTKTRVTECSDYPGAPRDLCLVERCPPPSFPDSPVASVQWIVEAILTLDKGTSDDKDIHLDERFFRYPTPSTLVTRVVFPFLPVDSHAQHLDTVPHFGRDLNLDPYGAKVLSEGKADDVKRLSGKRGDWRTYTKTTKLNTAKVMAGDVYLISELSTQVASIIPRSSPSMPVVLYVRMEVPTAKSLMSRRILKEVQISSAMISFKRWISTRGGKDIEPHTEVDTVRSEVLYPTGDQNEGSSSGSKGLVVKANEEGVVWEMEFDLQTENLMSGGRSGDRKNAKVSTLVPSFRTPNIQLEYVCNVMITVEGQGEYPVASFPVQLLTGDSGELPSFDEATGGADGRDDLNALPPAYVALPS